MNKLYLAKIDKKEYEKIKNKSIKEVNKENYADMYGMPYSFIEIVLSVSNDIAFELDEEFLEENTFPFFQKYKEEKDEKYNFLVCKDEKVILRLIESHEEKIEQKAEVFFTDQKKRLPKDFTKNTISDITDIYEYYSKMSEVWLGANQHIFSVSVGNRKNINIISHFAEHLIFEIIFLYKYFDYNKNYMVLLIKK